MAKKIIYISEPDEIKGEELKLLEDKYIIIRGDKYFRKNYDPETDTLFVRTYSKVNKRTLERFPRLKNIVRIGVGLDHIDTSFCKNEGIKIFNSAGSNSNAVAEYVVCLILIALKKIHTLTDEDLLKWNRFKFLGGELKNKNIGLVGFGNVGKLVYKKLRGFECKKVYIYDPFISKESLSAYNATKVSLPRLMKKSDIISIHVPLMEKTKNLINSNNLQFLNPGSIIINSSRGGVVSELDILKNLKRGLVFYIADVFENEPKINKEFINMKNFIGTPHIACMTNEANTEMLRLALNNFIKNKSVMIV